MSITITSADPVVDDDATHRRGGYEVVKGAQLRLGDVVDYAHGPAEIMALYGPAYLTYALGDGARALTHKTGLPRIVTGDQDVTVMLPRPLEGC